MTNKIIFLCSMVGMLFLFSCTNDNSSKKNTDNSKPEMVEETVVDEIPNVSEIDFEGALEAFANKKYALSAKYLDDAIQDIQDESKDMDNAVKEKVDLSVVALKRLSKRIKKGEIKDVATLERAFSEAEILMAHDYLIFSDFYIVDNPQKSQKHTQNAIDKMENAVTKLEGEAKTEAQSLVKSMKESVKRGDKKADKMGNAAGEKVEKWLAKHHIEIY